MSGCAFLCYKCAQKWREYPDFSKRIFLFSSVTLYGGDTMRRPIKMAGKNKFIFCIITILGLWLTAVPAQAKTIRVTAPTEGYCNALVYRALEEAAAENGKPTTIELLPGRYLFGREESVHRRYHISNTTSEVEDDDPTKHIALWLKGLKNVTIDGGGSLLLMDGEMTSFVIDSCRNITLKNFSIDFVAPTQTEFEVIAQDENHIWAKVHPTSHYIIEDGKLVWQGNGWSFSGGIAQIYDRERDITWRSWSPMDGLIQTTETRPGVLQLSYSQKPEVKPGWIFQMRDAIRDEVCGLIQYSRQVQLENIYVHYAGNFGIVGQYSENLSFNRLFFEPEPGSGRTNVGFADFLQISGCKGDVVIENSRFTGAHDDPINIHGTHLQVLEYLSDTQVKLGFMHHQTYGFQPFAKGDEVAFVNANTLVPIVEAEVKRVVRANDRQWIVELNRPLPQSVKDVELVSVENLTWTPNVVIRNNYFSRIPTRGILVTTRRKVVIENNLFFRMQMSAILIADDARSWFESGPVTHVTIRRNRFIECGEPVIHIAPENRDYAGAVHRNISVVDNHFQLKGNLLLQARSTDGILFQGNLIGIPDIQQQDSLLLFEQCNDVTVQDNRFYFRPSGL